MTDSGTTPVHLTETVTTYCDGENLVLHNTSTNVRIILTPSDLWEIRDALSTVDPIPGAWVFESDKYDEVEIGDAHLPAFHTAITRHLGTLAHTNGDTPQHTTTPPDTPKQVNTPNTPEPTEAEQP